MEIYLALKIISKLMITPLRNNKKTAKKMVLKEIDFIKNTLKRNISNNGVKMDDKFDKVSYEYKKRGCCMDLSGKENITDGHTKKPRYRSYISNAVETYMIDLGNDNFSAGINFNIGSNKWDPGDKDIQILSQRYGFDSLYRSKNNTYSTDVDKAGGIIKILAYVFDYKSVDWQDLYINFHSGDEKLENDDELYNLSAKKA